MFADKYSFPPRDKWGFVFIILPNMSLIVPRLWKLALRDLSYSAVVNVDSTQVPWLPSLSKSRLRLNT